MIKTLLFSILFAFASYAFFHPAADAAAASAATVELLPSSRVILKVTADMTVDDIIERVYPKDEALWPRIKQKLIETNPDSFVQYSDRLIPGVRLKLVDIKRIYEQPELTPKIRIGSVFSLTGTASASDINDRIDTLQINSQIFQGDRDFVIAGDDLMRLNKSFIVKRSVKGARQILAAYKQLSRYVRMSITEEKQPVWIAQREGRAKNGFDETDLGAVIFVPLLSGLASVG